jgi:plastocyanin
VFNGAVGALTDDNALQMDVGERARIYFVNAGLNLTSNFHPIGSHWDSVYPEAALLNAPLRGSQTTLVPAGGGTVVELEGQVPMTVVLVDHALARAFDKGAIGQIVIGGDDNAEIFEEVEPADTPDVEASAPPVEPSPQPEADAASGDTAQVSILSGSSAFQEDNDPDEFADAEDPGDYSVNVLEVTVGDTVTWTNDDDGVTHTVTAADESFDSGLLAPGESWSYTFTEAGEFEYLCTPHPWMRAKVIVSE